MMKPTEARAMAPHVRFARGESCGSEEEEKALGVDVREERATRVRRALREVK